MNKKQVSSGIIYLLFGVLFTVSSSPGDAVEQQENLYFGVFISQDSAFDFSGFIPPLELGVETINNHTTVLKRLNGRNYNISYPKISNAKVRL